MNCVVGVDIGSAHMKYCVLDIDKLESRTGIIPLWLSGDRMKMIAESFSFLVNKKLREYKIMHLGVVSSFEAAFAAEPWKSSEIQNAVLNVANKYDAYTFNERLKLVDMNREQWVPLSSKYSVGYVASLLLKTGLFIQMNSASTVIAGVKNQNYVSINPYKNTSGEGAWIGALYTPLSTVAEHGMISGRYCNLSPYGAQTEDIINILFPEKIKKALEKYGANIDLSYEDSVNRFLQLLGQLPGYNQLCNLENQVKLFSLMCYYKILDKIRNMVFQVLSFMDLDFNDTEIIISGVGKDLFLKESLRLFSNVKDVEEYLYSDLCINLESFAIAMAIAKEKLNLHIMEGVKTGKKN